MFLNVNSGVLNMLGYPGIILIILQRTAFLHYNVIHV